MLLTVAKLQCQFKIQQHCNVRRISYNLNRIMITYSRAALGLLLLESARPLPVCASSVSELRFQILETQT